MKYFKYIVIFAFVVLPFVGNAQLVHFNNVNLVTSPTHPGPNELVVIKAEGFSFNVNQSYFTWYIDGIVVSEGVGKTSIKFQTKKPNTRNIVNLVINTENSVILEEQIVIQPTEVALLWEALTDKPIFYKGKSLHTAGSEVKFVAIPNLYQNGVKVSSRNLVYTWKNGGTILGSLSGIGKNSITLKNKKLLKDLRVSVIVETPDELVAGEDSVVISVRDTEVFFYENDPLLGPQYNTTIKDPYTLSTSEITIVSEPFFFSFQDELSYFWKVKNEDIDNNYKYITLNSNGESTGSSQITVSVENNSKYLQVAKNSFNINFGEKLLDSLFNF